MARMIPDIMAPDAPASERRIFELLRDAPATKGWTVLHSLGLSSAYSGAYGEIDFVAVVPERGLICIEVKGGRVRCEAGVWTTTNRNGQTNAYPRSPFQQAREGMFKLLEATKRRYGKSSVEARCPLGWMVIFTDSPAPAESPDFERGELIDSYDLAAEPVSRLRGCTSLQLAVDRFGQPSSQALVSLIRYLRPDFDRIPTLATTLWDTEKRLVSLTAEQYDVLDHVVENDDSLVHGGAGTGKTMLAVELARRLSAEGKSVLLTCFNRELGLWLEARASVFGPKVVAGHLHRLLRQRIVASELRGELVDDDFSDDFYELAALAVAAGEERFDAVLVDEAQDFPARALLDITQAFASAADATPKRVLFADYSRQALYGSPAASRELIRREMKPANFGLHRNCRNTLRVTAETELLTGAFGSAAFERQPIGVPVERVFYGGATDQVRAIDRSLQLLRTEGFRAEDIVILGPRRKENTSLQGLDACGGFRITERERRTASSQAVYSTIQAFKGLESQAIVLIDIWPEPESRNDAMLYVGMTRARTRLVMVMPEAARPELLHRERENFEKSQAVKT
jgi:hypothetical protein